MSPAPPKAEDPPLRYCDRARRLQSATPPPLPGREALPVWESVQQAHLCGRLWDAEVKIGLAQERMASFLALFARPVKLLLQLLLLPFALLALLVDELLAWIVPGPGSALNQAKAAGGAYALAHNPRPDWSCEDFVMALTRHALPLCFTLLGTGISILRDCSQRMHRFELVPTTLPLGLSRLALGLAAGLSIALFNSPEPPAAILPGLPPPPPADMFLSAQALAFLAGYGVDSVFSFFDNQLSRLREPLPRPPAPRPS
ncbi:hypothetical protein BKE38_27830 [Pseudoroseomonas deserti]|uniref:Uncharacterized protein n=1 Tax=Teichococcus deserti TaxID=1817963 RepID=A0A1V2GU02_9PROT|nr:hypothetical protein BKE38_27830 [Pseudoroseomonas deserti]